MEKKELKAYFSKSSAGNYTPRVNFPKLWFDKLNITQLEREVEIVLDEEKQQIILKKKK